MADLDQQDRTEQPTPKRLEEARRHGDIPRSRDLSTAAVSMAGAVSILLAGGVASGRFYDMMRTSFVIAPRQALDEGYMLQALGEHSFHALLACAPIFGAIVLAAVLAPLMLGGWSFSVESFLPNFSRLSPEAGFKRMFSSQAAVELMKSLAKFAVVALVAVLVLRYDTKQLLSLGTEPPMRAAMHAGKLCAQAFLALAASLLVIAAIDAPYQLWQYGRRMRMSRQEIRREMKESEGAPEIKNRIRQAQQEMARRRMMQEVPKADVVVTNPTHYAVALRYDENRMRAPIVVAKGAGEIAARIREIAAEHKVALFEAPPLARVLYRSVDIGAEIPSALYVAVAQVLTYIFQLKAAMRGEAMMPERPSVAVEEADSGLRMADS
jgi:flagellar biosynthetic protein FlhB